MYEIDMTLYLDNELYIWFYRIINRFLLKTFLKESLMFNLLNQILF